MVIVNKFSFDIHDSVEIVVDYTSNKDRRFFGKIKDIDCDVYGTRYLVFPPNLWFSEDELKHIE